MNPYTLEVGHIFLIAPLYKAWSLGKMASLIVLPSGKDMLSQFQHK